MPVHTVAEGMVILSGLRGGYGKLVEADHGNGCMTPYANRSALDVHSGQRVQAGEVIAQPGSSGRSTGSHVHFEEWRDGLALNPVAFVRNQR